MGNSHSTPHDQYREVDKDFVAGTTRLCVELSSVAVLTDSLAQESIARICPMVVCRSSRAAIMALLSSAQTVVLASQPLAAMTYIPGKLLCAMDATSSLG